MIRILKNSHQISLTLTALFFLSVLVSAYMLYSLPGTLMLPASYYANMTGTYITVAVTFILGALAVYLAFKNKKELIVYKEKSAEQIQADAAAEAQRDTISLESVKNGINDKNNSKELFQEFMLTVCKQLKAGQGALYLITDNKIKLTSGYALHVGENNTVEFELGEGLIGQAATEGRALYVDDIPEGYIKIVSGLGSASPRYLLIVPVKDQETVVGVIEIASFTDFKDEQKKFVEQAVELLASKILSK